MCKKNERWKQINSQSVGAKDRREDKCTRIKARSFHLDELASQLSWSKPACNRSRNAWPMVSPRGACMDARWTSPSSNNQTTVTVPTRWFPPSPTLRRWFYCSCYEFFLQNFSRHISMESSHHVDSKYHKS